jgi:hypothetical protein
VTPVNIETPDTEFEVTGFRVALRTPGAAVVAQSEVEYALKEMAKLTEALTPAAVWTVTAGCWVNAVVDTPAELGVVVKVSLAGLKSGVGVGLGVAEAAADGLMAKYESSTIESLAIGLHPKNTKTKSVALIEK